MYSTLPNITNTCPAIIEKLGQNSICGVICDMYDYKIYEWGVIKVTADRWRGYFN